MSKNVSAPIVWPTTLLLIITPIIGIGGSIWYQLAIGFEWYHWLSMAILAGLSGISITAGYHRLWSHNAYKAKPFLRLVFAIMGAATYQNSILIWASQHRRHHRHVDSNEMDPYSANKGLWFSHLGWLLRDYPNNKDDFSNAKDLQRDAIVMWQHKYYYSIAFAINVLPPALLGAITGEYLAFFLSAGFARIVYTHHTTFFINSLAHFWGKRPYTVENTARDNGLLALVTYGEGYHNYHHKFQNDYRNGIRWYQFDPTKWLISASALFGLSYDLRTTPNFKIREAMVKRQLECAKENLANNSRSSNWQEYIEKEKVQFADLLSEWKTTREQWFIVQRDKLQNVQQDFKQSMENSVLSSRLKELDYAIQMQYQRLHYFNASIA